MEARKAHAPISEISGPQSADLPEVTLHRGTTITDLIDTVARVDVQYRAYCESCGVPVDQIEPAPKPLRPCLGCECTLEGCHVGHKNKCENVSENLLVGGSWLLNLALCSWCTNACKRTLGGQVIDIALFSDAELAEYGRQA